MEISLNNSEDVSTLQKDICKETAHRCHFGLCILDKQNHVRRRLQDTTEPLRSKFKFQHMKTKRNHYQVDLSLICIFKMEGTDHISDLGF